MRARVTNTASYFYGKTGDILKRFSRGVLVDIGETGEGMFFRNHEIMEASDDVLFGIGMAGGTVGEGTLVERSGSRKIND